MKHSWITWPIDNYKITALIVILLFIFGLYGVYMMPKDEFPPFTIRDGVVVAVMPGATAEEIEEQVARPLERYIFTYKEVNRAKTYSTSKNGMCYIMVHFNDDQFDLTPIWSKIKHGLNSFKSQLPKGVIALIVKDDFGDTSALLITIESDQRSYRELQYYSDELSDRLRRLPSISNIRQYGEIKEQLTLNVDRKRLATYGISQAALMQAISGQGLTTMSGGISSPNQNLNIHIESTDNSEEELANRIIFYGPDGKVVRIRDIATITREYDTSEGHIESNGKRCVLLPVEMIKGNNIVKFGKDVDVILDQFKEDCTPEDVQMRRITDQPAVVGESVYDFMFNLITSMIIIILVMVILFPLRSAIVAAITIPLSTFTSIGIMYALGIELNMITLASLIVVLGMIVDNSIVVIDGYMEYLGKGLSCKESAVLSVKQYFWPMFLATICICAIFFPFLFTLSGEAGDVIGFFPVTITINLLVSLAVAACIIPLLNTKVITKIKKKQEGKRDITDWVQYKYDDILKWNFRHPWLTIFGAIAIIIATAMLFPQLKIRQFPYADRNQFAVEIYLPEGSGLDETRNIVESLRNVMSKDERITGLTTFIGCSSPRFHTTYAPIMAGKNFAQFIVNTTSNTATLELLDEYATKYSNYWPNAYIRFKQMDYLPVQTYEYRFYGNNLDSIQKASDRLMAEMRNMPELEWVHTDYEQPTPVINIKLNPVICSQLGINRTMAELQTMMQTSKLQVGSIWESSYIDDKSKTYELPIILKDKTNDTMSVSDIENIYLTSLSGKSVPLRQTADIQPVWNNTQIIHRNGERCMSVTAESKRNVYAQPIQNHLISFIKNMQLPDGVHTEIGGETEKNNELLPEIIMGMIMALIIIFFFLLFNFRKYSLASICILAISLSIPGAMIGLVIANKTLSLTSIFGFITLMGMIMRNEILIFEHANQKRAEGLNAKDAAYDAGCRRMVPIFLTTATTAVGVIPMIIEGNSFWMPVGVTIFAGGIGMLILVTTVMPVIYWKLYSTSNKV